jgi:hypothetical protein
MFIVIGKKTVKPIYVMVMDKVEVKEDMNCMFVFIASVS